MSSAAPKQIYMLGAFPPPVHGMAVVNQRMQRALAAEGLSVQQMNIAAPSLQRTPLLRLARVSRVATCFCRFALALLRCRVALLYMSVSGGAGQVYEALFAAAARLFGVPVVLHHHSFAYLDKRSNLTALLCLAAGRSAQHIALCDTMGARLAANYPHAARVIALSNAAFIQCTVGAADATSSATLTVGFLGNLSFEKGIREFEQLVELCAESGLNTRFLLAGPTQDADAQAVVDSVLRRHSLVEYLGPLDDEGKSSFFQRLDLLIFPTRYKNEAEPMTILESLANSVPVLATARGCISRIVSNPSRHCIASPDAFAHAGAALIADMIADPRLVDRMRVEARQKFALLKHEATLVLDELLESLKHR